MTEIVYEDPITGKRIIHVEQRQIREIMEGLEPTEAEFVLTAVLKGRDASGCVHETSRDMYVLKLTIFKEMFEDEQDQLIRDHFLRAGETLLLKIKPLILKEKGV
jgi:hypothetical protein